MDSHNDINCSSFIILSDWAYFKYYMNKELKTSTMGVLT